MTSYRALWLTPEQHRMFSDECRRKNLKKGKVVSELVGEWLRNNSEVQ